MEEWKLEWDALVEKMGSKDTSVKTRLEVLKSFSKELSAMAGGKDHAEGYRAARAEFVHELNAIISSL